MDDLQKAWEERYASGENLSPDGTQPHPEVVALLGRLAPQREDQEREGRMPTALDLGCGVGRHTLALARAGYDPTALDFSPTAVRILREALDRHRLPGHAEVADLRSWSPQDARSAPEQFDLVLGVYFQHDPTLLRRAADWLAPGGRLLWITHAPGSLDGPPPGVPRPGLEETVVRLEGAGLDIVRAQEVQTADTALDVVLEAVRPR